MKHAITLALLSAPLFAAAAGGNLLTNGGFESTPQAGGSWSIVNTVPGWTVGPNGLEVRNGVAGNAFAGNNFVELDTTGNSSISQSFATQAGYVYELSFSFANRPDHAGAASNGISWSVGTQSGVVGNNTNTSWQTFSTSFTGTGNPMTLSFAGVGTSDSRGTSLDAVSVSVSAVPEPETYAMMLAGLGAVGLMARRRRQKD